MIAMRCLIAPPSPRLRGDRPAIIAASQERVLRESPLAHVPLLLLQQNASEFRQRFRADIVERPEDALAIFDGERDDLSLERKRLLEKGARRLGHATNELAHVLIRDPRAGEIHEGEATPRGDYS